MLFCDLPSVCRYKRLTSVSDRLSSWEGDNPQVPLEKLLGSMLENIRQSSGECSWV